MSEPQGFREFVEARSPALLRTAWMLTGDAALAEDLLQTALARTWPHWSRVADGGYPDAYVRKTMLRLNASWRSRLWHRERPTADPGPSPTEVHPDDEHAQADDRALLLTALAALPLRQRQVIVLRFFDDLSVESVADLLGISTGTVKSQTAKGLTKLRVSVGATFIEQEEV